MVRVVVGVLRSKASRIPIQSVFVPTRRGLFSFSALVVVSELFRRRKMVLQAPTPLASSVRSSRYGRMDTLCGIVTDEPVNLREERTREMKVGIGGERVYGCCWCCWDGDGEDAERGIWAQLRFR